MEQTEGWSQRIAAHVGRRVAYFREAGRGPGGRKLSTQALAERTRDLGHPLDRSVIAKLEGGQRQSISVPELVVLARALEVPPIQLLYPLGEEPQVELLPGRAVATDDALLWFVGRHDLFRAETTTRFGHGQQDPESGLHEWYETSYDDAAYPVHRYSEHYELVQEWQDAVSKARRRMPGGADINSPAFRSEVAHLRENVERVLRNIRDDMRRRGVKVLPDLPPELEHLR